MSQSIVDIETQLAFSLYENKGVFAVLIGSGISRSAEIPTGWEITLDLVRRVALAQGVGDQPDWAAWYRKAIGGEPNYSSLLEQIASSPDERRAIIHSYIEPTAEDRELKRKVPTSAHHAIAALVQAGFIRVIITTNFDRLMESALRERGIEPTIVFSLDTLTGAEPIAHSTCYILKLHGDYKDARILNTERELSGYPNAYNQLLDRIFDEYGLIICGWSGEWDYALRSALLRTPNRRYTTYWATRGVLGNAAQELVDHRRARIVTSSGADDFFSKLHQRVETLQQTHRQNPAGVELRVSATKRFMAKPEFRIQLDELFAQEVDSVLSKLSADEFASNVPWDLVELHSRIAKYESACEGLVAMMGVLGRWGDNSEISLVTDVIRGFHTQAMTLRSGLSHYLTARSYPAVLLFTAYGIGATRSERWNALHRLFNATIQRKYHDPLRFVETFFLQTWQDSHNLWKQMPGHENDKTPLSDYLLQLFSRWKNRFTGVATDFDLVFERFELLGSLAHLEKEDKSDLTKTLEGPNADWTWIPMGRASWDQQNAEIILNEFQSSPMKDSLLKAGFARSDAEYIHLFIRNFKAASRRMRF